MSEKYFEYKTLDDIRKGVEERGLDISFEEKLDAVFHPATVGTRTIGNSMGIHPMEGCDATTEGAPDELTFRRWVRFGEGGAKLIWGEATAVQPDGLANPRQLLLSEKNLPIFERMLRETRSAHRRIFGSDNDLLVGLQLTHSGRWSYRAPRIAYHHPQADAVTYADKGRGLKVTADYPTVTDDELKKLQDSFLLAAKRAYALGFDFVDIKQCHTYLLNELLGARTRPGEYGGSFENRTRLIRNVLGMIRSELGNEVMIASRFNAFDGVPFIKDPKTKLGVPLPFELPYRYSFGVDATNPLQEDLTEPIQLVRLMREYGVDLVNVSMGSPYYNMHYGRPFERTPDDGYLSPEHPLVGVDRQFRIAAEIQQAFPDLAVVGTGYSWLRQFLLNAGESNIRRKRVSIVAAGRGAIAYPDYAQDAMKSGSLNASHVCLAISYCTNLMRSKNNELGQYPAGCVPRDEVYTPIYKEVLSKKRTSPKAKS